jgi:Na+/H+-translocating membrane pyrophosphatase
MSDRPPGFRPLGDGVRVDVTWALAVLAGALLGAILFDNFAVLAGAAVGVAAVVVVRAVRRRSSSS